MRLSETMLVWLMHVYQHRVRRLTSIPANTMRALERRFLVARDPDTLLPVITDRGALVLEGALAARRAKRAKRAA